MTESLSLGRLPGGWEDVDGDGSHVATHSDAELYLWEEDDTWIVNLVQLLESDGYQVEVTTHMSRFDTHRSDASQECRAYTLNLLQQLDTGEDIVRAIAIVGHDGSTATIDTDEILDGEPLIDTEHTPPLADVFVTYPNRLPRKTMISDVVNARRELIAAVYGDKDSFNSLNVLESENEAYGDVTLEVLSVSEHSLERLSQHDDS